MLRQPQDRSKIDGSGHRLSGPYHGIGELQQEQVTDELSQLKLHKRTTKSLDSEELNLKRFARANVQRQLKLKAAVETRIKETTLMTTLDGALQNKVREVLQRERKAGKYPCNTGADF